MMFDLDYIVPYIEEMTHHYLDSMGVLSITEVFGSISNQDHCLIGKSYNCNENINYINEAKESIMSFVGDVFDECSFDIDQVDDVVFFEERIDDYFIHEYEDYFDRVRFCLLLVAFALQICKRTNASESYTINEIKDINQFKVKNHMYYRGQSNAAWDLVPSSFRGLIDNVVFDNNYYNSLLEKSGLNKKYNDLIKYRTDESIYYKYAFMQHACSFSPLIDFSKNEVVALSFALSNKNNINDYNNIPSKIFLFGFNDSDYIHYDEKETDDYLINKASIYYINKSYLSFGEDITFNNSIKNIQLIKIDDIIEYLTPSMFVIDLPTNDRMKYQKGSFLSFYDCLCLKGKIIYELCPDLKFVELTIIPDKKDSLKEEIRINHDDYDSNHILDPYLSFVD